MNVVTAVNTYDNTSGNIKALGFKTQDELLQYVFDSVKNGVFTEKNVLFKGFSGDLWSETAIRGFYRKIFGSSSKVLVKDYLLQAKMNYTGNKWASTYSSLYHHLEKPKWLLVWRQ